MSLFRELRRRNVFRVAALYLVISWVILQIADVLFGVTQLPDWSLTLVAVILALGLLPALIFAWVFELTPEGIKRESEVDRSASVAAGTGRKLDLAIVALLLLTIGIVAVDRLVGSEAEPQADAQTFSEPVQPAEAPDAAEDTISEAQIPSIAVLPFTNMSPDPDQEYFSDGLSDTLIHVLAETDGLRVIARTSSFAFKDTQMDVREIAQRLDVGHVLEGSVQKAGDQLRVIAQLIDAKDNSHVWSATFDRSMENVFAIQDEIASEVLQALKGTLLPGDTARLEDRYEPSLEAYQAFLRGLRAQSDRTVDGILAAREHFETALEHDPDYALARVRLAATYLLESNYGVLPGNEAAEAAVPHIERALEIDPDLGEAYGVLGLAQAYVGDFDAAMAFYRKGIELAPGYATTYVGYALLLGAQSDREAALKMYLKAAQLDPLSDVIRAGLVIYLFENGRIEEGLAELRQGVQSNPDFANYYVAGSQLASNRGDLGRAVYWQREAVRLAPGGAGHQVRLCIFEVDLLPSGRECLRSLARQYGRFADRFEMLLLMFEGRTEEVIELARIRLADGQQGASGAPPFMTNFLAAAYLNESAYGKAVEVIRTSNPELFADANIDDGPVTFRNLESAIYLAHAWHRLGEVQRSERLIDWIWPVIRDEPRSSFNNARGIADVRLHAISGDTEAALSTLEAALEAGWVTGWRARATFDPVLADLRKEPRFEELIRQLEERLKAQQAWLEVQPPLRELIEADRWGEL